MVKWFVKSSREVPPTGPVLIREGWLGNLFFDGANGAAFDKLGLREARSRITFSQSYIFRPAENAPDQRAEFPAYVGDGWLEPCKTWVGLAANE